MKILQVHNIYQQPGGEDQVCQSEYELLRRYGHDVEQFTVHNDAVDGRSKGLVALQTTWSGGIYRTLRGALKRVRPDILHAHNTFPLISPALYYAAQAEKIPVVQTLHNFRLICPAATLYRDGHVCEDCVGRAIPYPAVLHGCYRGSREGSAAVAAMISIHKLLGTWQHKVTAYIALSEFMRGKLIEGGLPAEKIFVKPNFSLNDPGEERGDGNYALYLGRLSEEKGIRTLLRAWEELPSIPLRIAGDGPLRDLVLAAQKECPSVHWLGHCSRERILELLKAASLLVIPSEWYECGPLTLIEATPCGTPAIVADLGSLSAWARDGGALSFRPGDAQDLSRIVRTAFDSPTFLADQRALMRSMYEKTFTAERNYHSLMNIYGTVLGNFAPVQGTGYGKQDRPSVEKS